MVSRFSYLGNLSLGYRYSFNGKENDADVKGDGNQIDYGMRVYDPRLGRFLSFDPLQKRYPELAPYQYASNSPISGIDLDGKEWYYYNYLFGWKESKYPKAAVYNESYMNKAGYYSMQQIHQFENSAKEAAEDAKIHADAHQTLEDLEHFKRTQNLFGLAYEISPVKAIFQATQHASNGEYVSAAVVGVSGVVDLGPLFSTFGKGYAAIAREIASQISTESVWKLGNFARGALLEAKAASGYISKGYEWLAESASPFFKTVDFYNKAEKIAISLKTLNAKASFSFENIKSNITALAELKKVGSTAQFGVERAVSAVELHIAIPAGFNKNLLRDVEKFARDNKVTLRYIDIK